MFLLLHSTPMALCVWIHSGQIGSWCVNPPTKYVCVFVPQYWDLVHHLSIPKKKTWDTSNFLTFESSYYLSINDV